MSIKQPLSTKKPLVDLENARHPEQTDVMQKIITAGHCPFCPENLRKYHKHPIIKESKSWILTTNQWPYKNTKYHFLLIYTEHATELLDLSAEAGAELFELSTWIVRTYQIKGGGLAMRFGEMSYSGGSIAHIHVQFVVPDLEKVGYEPVKIKIGKSIPSSTF